MLLNDIEIMVRQDLFDSTATRWTNSDIDRAIDKAVDRYSTYYPNILFCDMATQPYQRTYPYPTGWSTGYPALWIEKIIYPLQIDETQFAAPTSAPTLNSASGNTLTPGTYQYLVTFITPGGETTAGPTASITVTTGNQNVQLSDIPLAPSSPLQPGNMVIGRNLYRTTSGGNTYAYLCSIGDATSTTWLDTLPDDNLAGMPAPPGVNTSGIMLWPPYECDFSEYSNLYDSGFVLASGGNMGFMGAIETEQGPIGRNITQTPCFTLNLHNGQLPTTNTRIMRVFYATKHQIDSNGSSIPEIHRDIIVLGAVAYALAAYQIPTNDNFDFQDGALRDRIDDTHIPESWHTTAISTMNQFECRLIEIKQQRDFASSARSRWGDIPIHWNWL